MTEENYWKEKYADIHIRLTNRIAELEQENKAITKDYEEAYTKQVEYADDVIKLTQALEEIKDMCKFNFVAANPILDKINEVLK